MTHKQESAEPADGQALKGGRSSTLGDAELVARALKGDERAYATIYTRYEPVLSRRLRRVLVQVDEVEDVLQIAFSEAFRSLEKFQTERSLEAWLHAIAFRWLANHLRAKRRRSWLWSKEPTTIDLRADPHTSSADDAAIQSQLMTRLYNCMQRLPTKKRIAFALYEFEDLGLTEIATLLKESPQTVRARVQSARSWIQKEFSREERAVRNRKNREQEETP
ncbi:MAG: RNA polymerase sigma factor [Myxococcota bacterium]